DGAANRATRELWQPALALGGRSAVLDQRRGQHCGQEGHGGQRAPELFTEDGQLNAAKPLATVLLGNGDARPAKLAELAPQLVVGAPPLGEFAHAFGPGAPAQQLARGALDVSLVVAETEVHLA